MTPAIAEALASVLDIIGAHCDANEGRDIWPSGLAFAGDRLGVALGLDIDARWQDVAEALRALARPDVGLPDGWSTSGGAVSFGDGATMRSASSRDACVSLVVEPDGRIRWMSPPAPPAVYLHLLRAAGVSNG